MLPYRHPAFTNLVTSGVVDENVPTDLSSKYNSCVEMCPNSRFTLHLMKRTHKHFIPSLKVITGFDKYWFMQVIRDPPSVHQSLWHGCYLFETMLYIMRKSKIRVEKNWERRSVSLERRITFNVISVQLPPLFSRSCNCQSPSPHYCLDEQFCWGLAWASKINPKNQHTLNNSASAHTLLPPFNIDHSTDTNYNNIT